MPSSQINPFPPDLVRALGEAGQEEYPRLLELLKATEDFSAFIPVRSDFSEQTRDTFLTHLASDLARKGIAWRLVRLTQDRFDAPRLLDEAAPRAGERVVIGLVGLSETPDIVREGGAKDERPITFALLNHAREWIHRDLPCPLLIWCDLLGYRAFQKYAPDFFDHAAGRLTFLDAAPRPPVIPQAPILRDEIGTDIRRSPAPVRPGAALALAFYEDLLATLPAPTPARARALVGRGGSLYGLPTGNRRHNLEQAMACYREALEIYTEADFPADWAMTQNNLGIAYGDLPTGDMGENLKTAIACYQAALRVYTEADFPVGWAGTQNNLGIAYRDLPTGDRGENLKTAIACYQAALRVFTEADFPVGWASTQNNLGIAYFDLPTGDRGENLKTAIACYQAALRVSTEADFPVDWAETQNNLGAAYGDLPTGDRGENLKAAIACFARSERGFRAAGMNQPADLVAQVRKALEETSEGGTT